MPGGYAASDGAALHFVGEDLHRVVLSRPEARAYRVEARRRATSSSSRWRRPISASDRRSNLRPPERGPRSSPWAGAASRWSRRTPPSTTTCSGWRGAKMPKICLLPTASGDGEAQIRQFHATFGARACEPMHISLFRLGSPPDPAARDAARAGHRLRRRRLDARPARRLARARPGQDPARVLGGRRRCSPASPRARCAGSSGASRRRSGAPRPSPGLGFLPGSLSVHMDGEPDAPAGLPRRRSPTARSRPATPPTTASRCSSAAPSSTRSSARAPNRQRCGASRPTARRRSTPRLLARADRFGADGARSPSSARVRAMRR